VFETALPRPRFFRIGLPIKLHQEIETSNEKKSSARIKLFILFPLPHNPDASPTDCPNAEEQDAQLKPGKGRRAGGL
jgi:hypothetical protein